MNCEDMVTDSTWIVQRIRSHVQLMNDSVELALIVSVHSDTRSVS